ncbi:transposase [Pseudoxanthomonas sp. PXM01]|nr:transposase [Pseudoxanthomonas sp. PXM01]MBD9467631.1 transposase [Pseudoxanthomonas sp. PXM01]
MTRYRRALVPGGTYFFTVNLADRRTTLLVDHVDLLRDTVRHTRQRHPFVIDAMVVLPDHLHAVWTLPPGDTDFPMRWRLIKTRFSHGLPQGEHRRASRAGKGERGIWQRRYWEHLIRDEADLQRHIDYIHVNPVKHGYVARVVDWPYSTFHRFVREGLLSSDWGCLEGEVGNVGEMA